MYRIHDDSIDSSLELNSCNMPNPFGAVAT